MLTNTVTLHDRLPELGTITMILRQVRVPPSNITHWKCFMYSEHRGFLYHTSYLSRNIEEATMEVYVFYRALLV
jgi:hypothetical protein